MPAHAISSIVDASWCPLAVTGLVFVAVYVRKENQKILTKTIIPPVLTIYSSTIFI